MVSIDATAITPASVSIAALAASLVDGSIFECESKAAFVADNCSLDNNDVNDDQSRPLSRTRDG